MRKSANTTPETELSKKAAIILVTIFVLHSLFPTVGAAPIYRPQKVRRSLNTDQYILSIQKNNQVDIHTTNGAPIVDNAFPAITVVGKAPRPLKVDHRQSTRVGINDALGKGNGLLFKTTECEWRIATYPGQPFITVDLTYTNTTRKPVQVAELTPWTIGERGKGAVFVGPVGAGKVALLQNATIEDPHVRIVDSTERSPGHVAAQNRSTGDVFVAGFISHGAGERRLRLAEGGGGGSGLFKQFSALCAYDPPVVLNPGEQLQVDTLYVSIQETSLPVALRRFVFASKRVDSFASLPLAHRHGWDAGASVDLDDSTVRATMDRLGAEGAELGWSHVHLGKAWMLNPETLELDQKRFPNGLAPLAEHAHGLGLTLGMTVPLLPLDLATLSAFVSDCDGWGLDSIELEYAPATAGDDGVGIHPSQLRDALKDGEYKGRRPVYVRPVMAGASVLEDWGRASRQFYLPPSGNPLLAAPGAMLPQDGSGLADGQFVTAFSLAALTGANLRPTTPFSDQPRMRRQVLTRLIPGYKYPALPIDLLQEAPSQQWYLPLKTEAGAWTIVGLFNWDGTGPETFRTPLISFDLNPGVRYTVYDFWAGRYLGMIKDVLQVEVPAEGVRLLGLRYVEQRPMLVASNRHYTQGALDHTNITWSYDTPRLSGSFKGVQGFPYTLTFYLPEPYRLKEVACSEALTGRKEEGTTLSLSLSPAASGEVTWSLQF
jgi:hypothetical protein